MSPENTTTTCPLCSFQFEGESCHSSCPTSVGCTMIRCPNCAYEFVEKSQVVDFVRALFNRVAAKRAGSDVVVDGATSNVQRQTSDHVDPSND